MPQVAPPLQLVMTPKSDRLSSPPEMLSVMSPSAAPKFSRRLVTGIARLKPADRSPRLRLLPVPSVLWLSSPV
jgi:hypothetical protein